MGKLVYFNVRGRAETARLILAYAGVEYEDKRITFEEMPELKPSLPFGQVPVLEYRGTTLCQSMAIARFLAHEYGLYQAYFEKDETLKEEKMKKAQEETLPKSLANLEKLLEKRGGQYFVGNRWSWAELHFYQIIELILAQHAQVLDSFPKLKSMTER